MKNISEIRALLYTSFDFPLTEQEKILLQQGLEIYPELKAEKDRVETLRSIMGELHEEAPGLGKAIVQKIRNSDPKAASVTMVFARAIYPIAACLLLLLGLSLALSIGRGPAMTMDTIVGTHNITAEDALTYLEMEKLEHE